MSFKLDWLTDERRLVPQNVIKGGAGVINYNFIKTQIQKKADEFGVLLNFRDDTLEYGSFFNKQSESILIMSNAYHPEYESLLFRITYRGIYAVIDIYIIGTSTNFKHESSNSTGRKIMNMISGHNQKMREENEYYDMIMMILSQVFSENTYPM